MASKGTRYIEEQIIYLLVVVERWWQEYNHIICIAGRVTCHPLCLRIGLDTHSRWSIYKVKSL